MCQVQIVKPLNYKKITERDKNIFCDLIYFGDCARNDDAHGYFSDTEMYKSNQTFDYNEFRKKLDEREHKFLVGHNRYKTKGDASNMDNNHPFDSENFLVVHNGIISNDDKLKTEYNFDYKVETDSYIISALLEHHYKQEKDLSKLLKIVAEELYGTFSIVVYSKVEKRLFYFKQKSTDFAFGLLKTGKDYTLLGSTKKENLTKVNTEYLFGIFPTTNKVIIVDAEEEMIWEIKDEGLVEVDKFKERTYASTTKTYPVTHYSKCAYHHNIPSTLKGKMKKVANQIEKVLEASGIKVMNRRYNTKYGDVVFELNGEVDMNTRQILEYDLTAWGDCMFDVKRDTDGKLIKTEFTFDIDWSQIRDETDWNNLSKAKDALEVYAEDFALRHLKDYDANDDYYLDKETRKEQIQGLVELFGD